MLLAAFFSLLQWQVHLIKCKTNFRMFLAFGIFVFGTVTKVTGESVLDYVVDCSACHRVPPPSFHSFSCSIRCETEG